MDIFETKNQFGSGVVKSWASILDYGTRLQAEAISRSPIVKTHVALMPDAHVGIGACVGSAIVTTGGIIPAAVGVDIGCGVIGTNLSIRREEISLSQERQILAEIVRLIPAGVGVGLEQTSRDWSDFKRDWGVPIHLSNNLRMKAAEQFGTLGSGNHFAEVCKDETGLIWLLVHSGSRGIGNMLAQKHIKVAIEKTGHLSEGKDLAWLEENTKEFDAYLADLFWAQKYAYFQRQSMMNRLLEIVYKVVRQDLLVIEANCHHNYTEKQKDGTYLSRKGAIDANKGVAGIIPGSMGAATHIVTGLGNVDAHNTSPHGAGRLLARGVAKKTLDIEKFKSQMGDRTWQDRSAESLIDEAPDAYKPINVVMEDSKTLVKTVTILKQFINFKGA